MRLVELKPIRESSEEWELIEAELVKLLKAEIYQPLVNLLGLPKSTLKNSLSDLISGIQSGKIVFERGKFKGSFSASISRELRKLGATWDRKQGCYSVSLSKLPADVKSAIALSEEKFKEVLAKLDRRISQIVPEEIADLINLEDKIDHTVWRVEKKFQDSIKGITIAPKFSKEQAARISAEYTKNMQLYIKDWTSKEIVELRERVKERAAAGERYQGLIKELQRSYGVSRGKAKFLARQETTLLMTKVKQVRYQDAGVNEYIWTCVVGSPGHEVRPIHKALNGKLCRWDDPPIVNDKGDRKNPGQDFGCRCFARPVVRF